jgi:muconolactone D-isomerase
MKFLVQIETVLPALAPAERQSLLDGERARGAQLRQDGLIEHIWRIPGTLGNVGVWNARTVEDLHEAITSLPLWQYMSIRITALARHPLDTD